jgi:GDP-L-fucose synthase
MKYEKIVVTGGSGLVGKSLQKFLPNAIYLSSKDYDLTTELGVSQLYKELEPDCVIHLAGKVGGILDNVTKPAEYFTENVLMNTLLIDNAYKHGVKRFIGALSTCVYPDKVDKYPMYELDYDSGPPAPTNYSYAISKRAQAAQIHAYNKQYGTNYQYLIASNLYGEYDKFGQQNSHFISSLIRKLHFALKNGDDKIILFGTGKPMRQFLYADDFSRVIVHCLENDIYENMNVAPDENYSINRMAEIACDVFGLKNMTIVYDNNYPDGQFRKDVSNEKLKSCIKGFRFTSLKDGIKKTYDKLLELKTFDGNLGL